MGKNECFLPKIRNKGRCLALISPIKVQESSHSIMPENEIKGSLIRKEVFCIQSINVNILY